MNRQTLQTALKSQNVQAFLHALRLGEGTADDLGYYRIVGGGSFADDSRHPNVRVFIPRYNVYSTAAGAYQIIGPTWRGLIRQYGFEGFTPEEQDEGAVALIIEKHALEDIYGGYLQAAVAKCASIWASLPGSTAGQRTEAFEAVRQVYLDYGGVLT